MRDIVARIRRRFGTAASYEPADYWEGRATELIEVYDDPSSWSGRNWTRAGVEEASVPGLLRRFEARSVFVVGAGSGRQYAYLAPEGFALAGIDISPTLVAECVRRYPQIPTTCESVVGAQERHAPADAVVSSAVLQHVPPPDLPAALAAVQSLARRVVVIREATFMAREASYMWAHDYREPFREWTAVHDEVTDRTDTYEVRLLAWARP